MIIEHYNSIFWVQYIAMMQPLFVVHKNHNLKIKIDLIKPHLITIPLKKYMDLVKWVNLFNLI